MNKLQAYLPQDRRRALARGEAIPDRANGTALLADISGFTPLTEVLRETLGSRRGAEEVTSHLNAIYTALIEEVAPNGGSVINFAGDAITCWFDAVEGQPASRAVACAFALQKAMTGFSTLSLPNSTGEDLSLKVSLASGPARRFVVGDPEIYQVDMLAGATLMRMVAGDQLAQGAEVILDLETVDLLGDAVRVAEWRSDPETEIRYAVAGSFTGQVQPVKAPAPEPLLKRFEIRPWVHQLLYDREQSARQTFPTDFRPCVALFVSFTGIDYDADQAEAQVNTFIRGIQRIAHNHGGILLEVTTGRHGHNAYINFGALQVHEDDAIRAVSAARQMRAEIQSLDYIDSLRVGISLGVMRVGAFGSPQRRNFGALGDDVNLSARLMQSAEAGEILVSGNVRKIAVEVFGFEPRPPMPIKGKAEPLPVFALTGTRRHRPVPLQEPSYALPMIGRQAELRTIEEKLELAASGKAQVVGIVADAGLGKSRLVAEVIRAALIAGYVGYGGTCTSNGMTTPYLPWRSIWSAFFDLDPRAAPRRQIQRLRADLKDLVPERSEAMPLLGPLLGITIPETNLTLSLGPKNRKNLLHVLLEECLKASSQDNPLLIVIEDAHWIDAVSLDLLRELTLAMASHPVCFLLAYRSAEPNLAQASDLESLPTFTKIHLTELSTAESKQVIRAKFAQLYPAVRGAPAAELVDELTKRAQGNPFYLEELLNYLRDRGIDPYGDTDQDKLKLPESLHALIISRIDQLSVREKTTLKAASIIGRRFKADWLAGYYQELGPLREIKPDLNHLDKLEITLQDAPEPELAYLFKHIITHQVTYESLPLGTRDELHEQLARYLEETYPDAPLLDVLAIHYGKSGNEEKQRHYLRAAGEAAQSAYANDAALAHYGALLNVLTVEEDRIDVRLRRGEVLEHMGRWKEAIEESRIALDRAQQNEDMAATARCQAKLGRLFMLLGDYERALESLENAQEGWSLIEDRMQMGRVLIAKGLVQVRMGVYPEANHNLSDGLKHVKSVDDRKSVADALDGLAHIASVKGDFPGARSQYEESLAQRRELDDKSGVTKSLINLGLTAYHEGDLPTARALQEEGLSLAREAGDKRGIAIAVANLGLFASTAGEYDLALEYTEEGRRLFHEMGDQYGVAESLNTLGNITAASQDFPAARAFYEESLALHRVTGDKRGIASALANLGYVALLEGDINGAQGFLEESLEITDALGDKRNRMYVVQMLGWVALVRARESNPNEIAAARELFTNGLELASEIGDRLGEITSLVYISGIAAFQGEAQSAVRLVSASDAQLNRNHLEIEPDVRLAFDATIDTARSILTEEDYDRAWAEGQTLNLEDAVALASEIVAG